MADFHDGEYKLRLWEARGNVIVEKASSHGFIYDMEFSGNGRLLVLGCEQGFMVLSVTDLEVQALVDGSVTGDVATQSGGDLMATLGFNWSVIEIWSLASNRLVTSFAAPPAV